MRTDRTQVVAHNRVTALEAKPAQFLMQADRCQIRVAFQQLHDLIGKGIEQTRPGRTLPFHNTGPVLFVIGQHTGQTPAGDSQLQRDAALRGPAVVQTDDLIAYGFSHRLPSPPTGAGVVFGTELLSSPTKS